MYSNKINVKCFLELSLSGLDDLMFSVKEMDTPSAQSCKGEPAKFSQSSPLVSTSEELRL